MHSQSLLVFVLICVGFSQAVLRDGQCPTVTVMENFEIERYLGQWYEIQRYEQDFQVDLECVTAKYTMADPNVARVIVINDGVMFNETKAVPFQMIGLAVPSFPEDERTPAKFSVAFYGEPDRSNYWVLGTDYTGYSLVWSCEQITENSYIEFAWVLSRDKYMTPVQYAGIYSLIGQNNLSIDDFRFTEQSVRCYLS